MENKDFDWFIILISFIIFGIIFTFNYTTKNFINDGCSHGSVCPMYTTLSLQTTISFLIALIILGIGIFLIFAKEKEKVILKTKLVKPRKKKISLEGLDKKEKEVIQILEKEKGVIFQKDLMEKINIGKVGMTRLLDKLEAKQLVERKRRGMNNIVLLKQ